MAERNVCFNGSLLVECPYCRHLARFAYKGGVEKSHTGPLRTDNDPRIWDYWRLFQCTTCEGGVMFYFVTKDQNTPVDGEYTTFPNFVPAVNSDVAGRVRDIFTEALTCYGAGAWNAVGTMCRRAVEEALIDKGAKGGDLHGKIEDAATKLSLPSDLIAFAHQVRIMGRDAAHANDPQSSKVFIDLSRQDADDAVTFCNLLFDCIYGMQAKLARAKASRPK